MSKQLRLVIAIIIMIGFILLGIYILKTSNTITGQIIGWSNITFFSGFLVWAFIKYMTKKKVNHN
ncbi:hypothetical protein [Olleya marilimosa]|uniref:Uncharacterized protein n=1 Tax=Olleya marilimosa TaxID=272164 RepID=A0ABR8LPJ0_9FLAO|nr:hypothetical protein [Olleya marilimosa]MBD3862116.1 hypothetical protein [Olleya marilimosa]MBD3889610.1 hypothetical protein [Olleya marilimosa]